MEMTVETIDIIAIFRVIIATSRIVSAIPRIGFTHSLLCTFKNQYTPHGFAATFGTFNLNASKGTFKFGADIYIISFFSGESSSRS